MEYVAIIFLPCDKNVRDNCAQTTELNDFMSSHSFSIITVENFINFGDIKDEDKTVEQTFSVLFSKKNNIRKSSGILGAYE